MVSGDEMSSDEALQKGVVGGGNYIWGVSG